MGTIGRLDREMLMTSLGIAEFKRNGNTAIPISISISDFLLSKTVDIIHDNIYYPINDAIYSFFRLDF